MDKFWRPEGWVSPHSAVSDEDGMLSRAEVYEAGASAIIPAIRQAAFKEVWEWMKDVSLDPKHYHDGWPRRQCGACMDTLFEALEQGHPPEVKPEGKVPLRRGGYEVGDAAYGP